MDRFNSSGIIGIGSCLPEKILTNFDLEKIVDTSDEWIQKRTGIKERRILDDNVPAYSLGLEAARNALKDSGLKPEDINLIIVTSEAPDYLTPSTACIIQNKLGCINAAAFDLNAACSGFVYGITIADQFIKTGYYKNIMIIGCEGLSRILDWSDRNTCVLLGDGSGAVIMSQTEDGYGVISTNIGADGGLGHNITIPCCYFSEEDRLKRPNGNQRVMWMDGSEVFKFAVRIMAESTLNVVKQAGINVDDVKMVIPHQANIRIIEGAAKRMGISQDRIYTNLHKYGNISSASIPVALEEVIRANEIEKGDYLVFVGFGGGLTWASTLIRWNRG